MHPVLPKEPVFSACGYIGFLIAASAMPQRISVYARPIEPGLSDLPDELRHSAYVAERRVGLAAREDAKAAARWLAAQGYGILGGEVWEILGNGHWQGGMRSATGPIPFVWGWETDPRWEEAEPWSVYVKRGTAPTGDDGKPVELHHRGQQPGSPLDEMTRTDHRIGDNYAKNHPNTGQEDSKIDRGKWGNQQKNYWKNDWDRGRWARGCR